MRADPGDIGPWVPEFIAEENDRVNSFRLQIPGEGLSGLTELVGTHRGQNVLLSRENDRGCASGSCYYASR